MLYSACMLHECLRLMLLWWVVPLPICCASPKKHWLSASSGEDSLCSMQTMDVIRAGLDTHQDNLVTIFASSHGFISWETTLAKICQTACPAKSHSTKKIAHEWHIKYGKNFECCQQNVKSITLCPNYPKTLYFNMYTNIIQYQTIHLQSKCAQQDHCEQRVNNG